MLSGGRGLIAAHRPVLFVEDDRPSRHPELVRTLRGLGYSAFWAATPVYEPGTNFRGVGPAQPPQHAAFPPKLLSRLARNRRTFISQSDGSVSPPSDLIYTVARASYSSANQSAVFNARMQRFRTGQASPSSRRALVRRSVERRTPRSSPRRAKGNCYITDCVIVGTITQ